MSSRLTGLEKVETRLARVEDAAVCGQICYDAFKAINQRHGFPGDFPNAAVATNVLRALFTHPRHFNVVAEVSGRVAGSNCLDERAIIAGVGPLTIEPSLQNRGIGRSLMEGVMARAHGNAAGVRLVQASFHSRSLSLYTSFGFDVREPLSCMQGRTTQRAIPGCVTRLARISDLDACNALARAVHGFEREGDFTESIKRGVARVVEREGRITAYATTLAFSGHATAESNLDLQALITSVDSFGGPGILVPTRNAALFRWCLMNGLRVVQPMMLMATGLYNEPAGAWLPSVLY